MAYAFDFGVEAPSLKPSSRRYSRRNKVAPEVAPEYVLKAFNTRAFKRRQPDNPELMLQIVSESIAQRAPIPFILYWGKGFRCNLGEPEFKCLDYLAALARRVREVYEPGAKITLIFTDTHAELNGHSAHDIRVYFDELSGSAVNRGFKICLLSQLMLGMELEETSASHETVPSELLAKLYASASKWFKGTGTVQDGAIRYYQLNMIEKRVVELVFHRSIFVTFNSSEFRSLLPSGLPIFYMFSVRHGISDKPWFLPVDFFSPKTPSNQNHLEIVHSA